ncbi:MAG: hypothetical protein JWM34_4473 [Ilumatobacteraceae bacterium]|nr:hypothetical protein [Ilumatobacteraceae bacterium]
MSTSHSHPARPSAIEIARWIEHRLDASIGFHLPSARLYGVVVNDADLFDTADCDRDDAGTAARSSFIGEARDVYSLLTGSFAILARSFDAAAVVTGGWAAPMLDDGTMTHRPSRHPQRRRVRAVAVVADDGVASVIRFEDDPTEVICRPERGVGDMVDALEAMWFGDATDLVNLRTTRGACTRHP